MHDFVRDSVRAALMKARPIPQFATEIHAHPTASPSLIPEDSRRDSRPRLSNVSTELQSFELRAPTPPAINDRFHFTSGIAVEANAAVSLSREPLSISQEFVPDDTCAQPIQDEPDGGLSENNITPSLATLKPLGQIRDSFILAVNHEGLWIIDQHVAHERVLFEKILKQRATLKTESQRLLMPLVLELTPAQQAVFAGISDELNANGFEAEPFGSRSIAIKVSPAGLEPSQVEHMLHELLEQFSREDQALNMEKVRARIAASIACHAAIKVNMPLEQNKMEWLITELAKTECPISCPHGRPIILRYSMQDIQKAFKRI
jgi:DNA mismatch repair protein MutL